MPSNTRLYLHRFPVIHGTKGIDVVEVRRKVGWWPSVRGLGNTKSKTRHQYSYTKHQL